MIKEVNYNGTIIKYNLERKKVKNINLRIKPDLSVSVSANKRVSMKYIDSFVMSKKDFILRAQKKISLRQKLFVTEKKYSEGESFTLLGKNYFLCLEQTQKNTSVHIEGKNIVFSVKNPNDFDEKKHLWEKFLKNTCVQIFTQVAESVYPKFATMNVPFPEIKIRKMKAKWGLCIPSKKCITLNSSLIFFDKKLIEYVITHEFCHFIYLDHSKKFYAAFESVMSDWKERKKTLNSFILL